MNTPSDGRPFHVRIATPEHPLVLAGGDRLDHVDLEVQAWGTPLPDRSNAILLCHSFSADTFAAGSDPTATESNRPWRVDGKGWWDALVGPGKPLDTNRYWVVCSNVLGGSGGSTGPATASPDGKIWGRRFPFLSLVDLVEAQVRLSDSLGVERWKMVVGGSLGGLQALVWAVRHSHRVGRAVPLAVASRPSLSGIGHFAAGCVYIRRELESGGDGYEGLLASFGTGRRYSGPDDLRLGSDLRKEWPLERYHPWTYVRLAEALMVFDLAAEGGNGDLVQAVTAIRCPLDLVSFQGDLLFPPADTDILADAVRRAGGEARHHSLPGPSGHDTFLDQPETLAPLLAELLA